MAKNILLNQDEGTVTIVDLTIKNFDFVQVLLTKAEDLREQTIRDVIAVGSTAMQRVQTTIDLDYVERRFATLATGFSKALQQFGDHATDTITKRFSPSDSGSYVKPIIELVDKARRDVQNVTTDLDKKSKELLDPNLRGSAVGRIDDMLAKTTTQIRQMFDPDNRTSYSSRLNDHLASIFGTNGDGGELRKVLAEALKPVFDDLQEVKEKLEGRKAAEQVIASSTLKGKPFEEEVHTNLCRLAQAYGDDVQSVGTGAGGTRAGDFIVNFGSTGKRVVVEARNRKQTSLPAIKTELDREMSERAADFAICVSSGIEMLPASVGDFQVYDKKIIATVQNIHIAYRLARLLVLAAANDGTFDVGGLRALLSKARDSARSLRNVKSKATQAKNCAEGILSDAACIEDTMIMLLDQAEALLERSRTQVDAA